MTDFNDLITAVKEWRYAREAVLAHQLEFEKTKKGMEVTAESSEVHIALLGRLGNAEYTLMVQARKLD